MKTTRTRVHPLLAEQIDKLYERLIEETGAKTLPKGVPSKIIGEHLRNTHFVDDVTLFELKPSKQRRRQTMLGLKV